MNTCALCWCRSFQSEVDMAGSDDIDKLLQQAGMGSSQPQNPRPPQPAQQRPVQRPAPPNQLTAGLGSGAGNAPAASSSNAPRPSQPAPRQLEPVAATRAAVAPGPMTSPRAPSLPAFDSAATVTDSQQDIALIEGVHVRVQVLLGRTKLSVEEILKLGAGSVVELDRLAGEPLDILVNDKLVARGEVLVLNDNFCVRVTEIIKPETA
ncbi:MAG: flagellar motor switch protein FliN [Planctomycetes bacterium]|nr:flagellar motor switch protein FliN [Planctomycetota bacterium]